MDNFRRILVSLNEIPSGYKSGDQAVAGEFIESIYIPINEDINCGTIKLCDKDKVEFKGSNTDNYRYENLIRELEYNLNNNSAYNYKYLGGAAIIALNCGFQFEGIVSNSTKKTYKCVPTIIAQNPGVNQYGTSSALTFPVLYPSSEYGRLYLKLPLSKMILVDYLLVGNGGTVTPQTKNYYKVISLTSDCYYKPLSE